ncbi:MAG: hypothetical protein AB7T63_08525 [Planctomycetota bacterium]
MPSTSPRQRAAGRIPPWALAAVALLVGLGSPPPSRAGAEGAEDAGIRWESDLVAGLERARREGRPILFAINALDEESANNQLAFQLYRSRAWGDATRGYVCFACSPGDHMRADGTNARFPGTPSSTCQAAFRHVVERYVEEAISPQHVIVEPDGTLAYRKPYFTGEVGPALLEAWLSRIAPAVAYSQASLQREDKVRQLLALEAPERASAVRDWALSTDGLAVGGILGVLDDVRDANERARLVRQLVAARPSQAAVMEWASLDAVFAPDDEPEVTLAWVEALLHVDPERGAVAAARALARSSDEETRTRVLETWSGPLPVDRTPLERLEGKSRAAAIEALALAGDRRGLADAPGLDDAGRARIARARRIGGLATNAPADVAAFDADDPLDLAHALERMPDATVRARQAVIEDVVAKAPWLFLRARAALALVGSRTPTDPEPVVQALLAAIVDPVEGPDVRELAVGLLGEDPGTSLHAWREAVERAVRVEGPR